MRVARTTLCVFLLAFGPATTSTVSAQVDPHAGHQMPAEPVPGAAREPRPELPASIPPLTDDDRKAAFPDVDGHAAHDNAIHYFVLGDRLEWRPGAASAAVLDASGWIGGDRDRMWFRVEGESGSLGARELEMHLLYGRQISRWWDIVGGVRQDVAPGSARTWLAVGVQGLAPYWFEIDATAYVRAGVAEGRVEIEYDMLLTNRLVLQPRIEAVLRTITAVDRAIGASRGSIDTSVRVRYELTRELAPYIGVTWKSAGEDDVQLVTGLRFWF